MTYRVRSLAGVLAVLSVGGTAACGSATHTVTTTVTVVKTKDVPVPGETQTVTMKVPVPGPTTTVTKEVPAPPPPQGAVTATFSGSGNQVTAAFNVPDDGDYIVVWSFAGNVNTSFGTGQASNFIVTETGDGEGLGLPNTIAASGSGSTEVTGAPSSDRLNVQAIGQWTLTIKSA